MFLCFEIFVKRSVICFYFYAFYLGFTEEKKAENNQNMATNIRLFLN